MKCQQINETCFYFHSPVNVGYIKKGDSGLLIDAGIDSSAIKKVLRQLDENGWPLTHLFITHAHADHYGGAAYIQQHYPVKTYAPEIEADVMRYPKWEPLYLFQGTAPPDLLRNKFLEAPAAVCDECVKKGPITFGAIEAECIPLPGHSENQMGLKVEGVLYASDAYLGQDELDKHQIPFQIDTGRTLDTLKNLMDMDVTGMVPGHGVYEMDVKDTLQKNIEKNEEVSKHLYDIIAGAPEGLSHEEVIRRICNKYHVTLKNVGMWVLYRTAISAHLVELERHEKILFEIREQTLWLIEKV